MLLFQVSVGLGAGHPPPVLPQNVRGVEVEADRRGVLNRPGYSGSEGRPSGCEQDEYLKPLRAGRQR